MSQPFERADVVGQWDEYADRLRLQLPAAPTGLLDAYNRYMPWVFIVFGVVGLLGLLLLLGLGAVLTPLMVVFGGSKGLAAGGTLWFDLISGIVLAVLQIVGGIQMGARKHTGWWLIAVGQLIGLATALLSLSVFGLVIRAAVGYVHLLVKPTYVN